VSRVLDRIEAGEVALGSMDTLGSPRLTEVMALAGIDALLIDQMFCPTDWESVAAMVRSARNFRMDTIVRVPGFPWLDRTDHHMAVDAVRALGVGATGVMVSCATVEEVAQLIEVSKDWHRDIHLHPFGDEEFDDYQRQVASDCLVMPLIESASAIGRLDEILALPGLRAVSLGMTDISRMLGHPFEYEHPEVERMVADAIEGAHRHGVAIGANLGYRYSRSLEDMGARMERMAASGLDFLWLQNNGFVIQWMYHALADLRPRGKRTTGLAEKEA
jgi:2-keto-3-deoxy-L-rhamnonate aldolase RhmA